MTCDCGHSDLAHGLFGCLAALQFVSGRGSAQGRRRRKNCKCKRTEDELRAIEAEWNKPGAPLYYDTDGALRACL